MSVTYTLHIHVTEVFSFCRSISLSRKFRDIESPTDDNASLPAVRASYYLPLCLGLGWRRPSACLRSSAHSMLTTAAMAWMDGQRTDAPHGSSGAAR